MTHAQDLSREIWLMDYFGRFLHNDPRHDRIVAVMPDACPGGLPGLILNIDPSRDDEPFALVKRETSPMPLPQIEPVTQNGLAIALRVLDRDGPYAVTRDCFFSSQPSGEVLFDRSHYAGWEFYAPIPARMARTFFPGSGIVLRDDEGNDYPAPRPETGHSILIAGRTYPLDLVSGFLAQLGALEPGENRRLVLPALGGKPELSVVASSLPT
ncbi:hypothetical protein [Acetobacter fallax]|uniref:Uncharacterized protein n=1 Tax=Acetobacter fallax TaxID=1737473 RepID=A0ABX0KAA2_9PROT|nr:hypothetical protein [Acetobacter fallax]NHO31916.1 hypothetical protein [Acetobacter fallax]NHO35568.1 hypothetical protein [Acetobacter fallax]